MAENTITNSEAIGLCKRALTALETLSKHYPQTVAHLENPDRSLSDLWSEIWICITRKVDACGWSGLAAVADLVESWPTADEAA